MSESIEKAVKAICQGCGNDRTRLMDIVEAVQAKFGCVSAEAMDAIAAAVGAHRVEVAGVVSFYAFLSSRPTGKVVIRLCDDIVDRMHGADRVARAFCQELGIAMGETTADGAVTLEHAPCIGLCDQAPAALINDVPVTHLSSDAARQIARDLKQGVKPAALVRELGDGKNADPLVRAMVSNNLRKAGDVVFGEMAPGAAIGKALAMSSAEVIRDIKTARLRGRGGAGFPTGLKWEFTRGADGDTKYVLCNADEGEPGTFKDRVILTERADMMFEGMTIAGYAIGAAEGILYLRAEYAYLRPYLEKVLADRRTAGLLGKNICGRNCFDFDIRIQMGAGAYICGEETALISSCEGLRGDPKNRPPFPAQKGYLGCPTTVNNVETFCCVCRILENGPGWFAQQGSSGSPGTKVLSVSGDCLRPGVYEVPFGTTLNELLAMVGAEDAAAVQVGGPSGQMVGPKDFARKICYDDLATGGSIVVFNGSRDVLDVAEYYMDFFIEESCGYCTPCRVGNVLLKQGLAKVRAGRATPADLDALRQLGETVKAASRCGLGQTSPNPVLTTLANFRAAYEARLTEAADGLQPTFDIQAALAASKDIQGRASVVYPA
ncbi:MAG: NADH:ubiquinone oxidoreductase [Planctomycetes bacterium]|nr:NADH:ubiquinone oxidoreductase [Planctomycetota bacterium]